MSILGVVVRMLPAQLGAVVARLAQCPGVDVALNPGDGRVVLVIEDARAGDGTAHPAASTLAAIATWPEVLNTSLVYEYSGPDAPGLASDDEVSGYRAWRGSLKGEPPPQG